MKFQPQYGIRVIKNTKVPFSPCVSIPVSKKPDYATSNYDTLAQICPQIKAFHPFVHNHLVTYYIEI